ncbi:hypothetical protein HYS30_02235 [Candidatus Peregrinibacteria bacterium]|nr:hypothetical protein [Candidatus Peregrinibacteria bacterium]MBI2524334.1 hypothetical protein [Candidatus Peregrinibacteria bacterium]
MIIVRDAISRAQLKVLAEERFGDMVKAVVDCKRRIMALGGELHADEEQLLLEDGSDQKDLWGINLYPENTGDGWIEFDSMINIRPQQNNRSRGVEDPATCSVIIEIVSHLVP